MAELLKIEGFKASNGWLDNFKERHGIVFKAMQGEAAAVDLESVDKWRQDVLSKLLTEYAPANVFNVDETGLFWRLMPDKTMTFKGAQFLANFNLPNFYFHAATAHGILRSKGVEIGKRDFMGVA